MSNQQKVIVKTYSGNENNAIRNYGCAATIVALLLCFQINAISQDKLYGILPTDAGKVKIEEVVQIDSTTKDELYTRAKRWIIETFKSANDVIQLDDKQSGEVIAKGYFETNWQATFMHIYKVKVYYITTIRLKDNKYKYELSNLRVKYYLPADKYSPAVDGEDPIETFNQSRPKNAAKFIANVDEQIKLIIDSLKSGMKKTEKKDW